MMCYDSLYITVYGRVVSLDPSVSLRPRLPIRTCDSLTIRRPACAPQHHAAIATTDHLRWRLIASSVSFIHRHPH
jgi:hypothetical protein